MLAIGLLAGFLKTLISGTVPAETFELFDKSISDTIMNLQVSMQMMAIQHQTQTYNLVTDISRHVETMGGLQAIERNPMAMQQLASSIGATNPAQLSGWHAAVCLYVHMCVVCSCMHACGLLKVYVCHPCMMVMLDNDVG
jgi:hypothetical protein